MPSSRYFDFQPKLFSMLKHGYSLKDLRKDLLSGITVGIVALPLAMAFGIASGGTPAQGLFTAIIAGFLISALGGSRYQIGGPTGAFVIIIASIINKYGYDGLLLATIMAGVWLIIFGAANFGNLIKYIPFPVTTGFTTGIAILIFTSQIKDFFGLKLSSLPTEFIPKWLVYLENIHKLNWNALGISLLTLFSILLLKKFFPKLPGRLLAIIFASLVVWILGLKIDTIGSLFGNLPNMLPHPQLPPFSFAKIKMVLPDSFTIALLAAIESLLSAVVADGMTGDRHNSNTELISQGIANIFSAIFGGMPATGAIARTATNIKSGAFSPISGIVHSLVLLLFILFCANMASVIPLASLSAVLVLVAWDMSEIKRFRRFLVVSRSDTAVLLITFSLTLLVDLTVAVQTGVVLASLLFMRRMSELTSVYPKNTEHLLLEANLEKEPDSPEIIKNDIPAGLEIYEINGPFFFGVATLLQDTLAQITVTPKVFLLRLRHVPSMDATGISALETFYEHCHKKKTTLLLSGVRPVVLKKMKAMGTYKVIGAENIHEHTLPALQHARKLLK